jgi:hypothetical protein
MPPIHLSDFKRNSLSYSEMGQRFCLLRETGTHLRAYNIDISGTGNQYFKSLYSNSRYQGKKSADGIYTGSFHHRGKQIYFVVVLELEGNASKFEEAARQITDTLLHFSNDFDNLDLDDDGMRHHRQAAENFAAYSIEMPHLIAGVVIGSKGRIGDISSFRGYPIICLGSRRPVYEITPQKLFELISAYTGNNII